MNCVYDKGSWEKYDGDALVALTYLKENKFTGALKKIIDGAMEQGNFSGEKNELFQVYPCEGLDCGRLLIVGMGRRDLADNESFRRAAGTAVKNVRKLKRVGFALAHPKSESHAAILEGALLGNYRFDEFKAEKKKSELKELSFFGGLAKGGQEFLDRKRIIAEATLIARDFANLPANVLTPARFASDAEKLGKKYGIKVKVINEPELKKMKMGALLSVGKGSENRPKLVVWEYKGGRKTDSPLVFVGKGITFDSGGISIKPSEGMWAMKGDMGGAGAVISLIPVLGQIKPKINVIGITPLAENMPSGSAYRPGDILTASNGKTIEIMSTDAEGRLILADALAYAGSFKPKAIVDIATLTGACMVALGIHICAGVMGKDQKLIDQLIKAGQNSGERVWQLPLWREYGELLKTPAADMKNGAGRWGGAITAGAFLSNFVESDNWAHVDMAGMDSEEGDHPYRYKGGTGWGVRLLANYILERAGIK